MIRNIMVYDTVGQSPSIFEKSYKYEEINLVYKT